VAQIPPQGDQDGQASFKKCQVAVGFREIQHFQSRRRAGVKKAAHIKERGDLKNKTEEIFEETQESLLLLARDLLL